MKDTEGKIKAVRFILPDGTKYTVLNDKTALRSFKKLVNKVYTPIRSTPAKDSKPSLSPKAHKQIDWGDKTIVHGEWVSDGTMVIKGFKPPNRPIEKYDAMENVITSYQAMGEKANPAETK